MVSIIDRFLPRGLVTAPYHTHTRTNPHTHTHNIYTQVSCMFTHSQHTRVGGPILFACTQVRRYTAEVKFAELNTVSNNRTLWI